MDKNSQSKDQKSLSYVMEDLDEEVNRLFIYVLIEFDVFFMEKYRLFCSITRFT